MRRRRDKRPYKRPPANLAQFDRSDWPGLPGEPCRRCGDAGHPDHEAAVAQWAEAREAWLTENGYGPGFSPFGDLGDRLAARRDARLSCLPGVAWRG